ncbi:MAG: NACHT domain-containing NTPase [Sulfurimonas sp.]|uniref:NACHT domain-containing protein n=1 Tax=Sulfurimonas sp. TaxID=2022749 RepID=UPI003D13B8BE
MSNKINFIPRKFQHTKSKEIIDFSSLTKIYLKLHFDERGWEEEHKSTISIVLGEPASGKTYQFEKFYKDNKDKVYFKQLINIENRENIGENIEIILLDSIDEALTNYLNPKMLQDKLVEFIKSIQAKNENIIFVISCRFLEWSEYFEKVLKEIDDELRVYKILDISEDDINKILNEKKIYTIDFWSFIADNYLEFLLKNILVILKIIDNYKIYKMQSISYADIYMDIVKEQLSVKGSERNELSSNANLNDLIVIASSLATYMILNRKTSVSIDNLMVLSNELYKIQNKFISSNDVKVILNTTLFKKVGNNFSFFHKSIQEFLMAYFIDYKKLDLDTIKKLFSHELRFYEEFEEVIIYLTNIQKTLFDKLVDFDPFIFKRHPNLDESQQQKLLSSMLNKLQNDKSMVWGKWSYFDNTTLVNFAKVKDIAKIVQKNVKVKNVDNALLPYLMKLVEYNYSIELENEIFIILENLAYDKNKIKQMIEYSFIDNYNFNKRLFDFMKKYDLFTKDRNIISLLDFETKLFESLYGVKYGKRYGDKKATLNRTNFEFKELLVLLDYIPHNQLKYIVPYLTLEDANIWFEDLKNKYKKNEVNYKYVTWILYALLLNCNSKETITGIIDFLCINYIYSERIDKDEMPFEFKKIANYFWEVYFSLKCEHMFHLEPLLKLLNVSLFNLKEVILTYPIENNIDKYLQFRYKSKDIEEFLLQDESVTKYLIDIEKQRKKQDKEWNKKNKDLFQTSQEQEEKTKIFLNSMKQLYHDSIFHFSSKQDFYNIFNLILQETQESSEIDKKLRKDLEDKYPLFIDKAKEEFKHDISYLKLKDELNSNSLSNSPTFLFSYLFEISTQEEIHMLVNNKESFEKLFWHSYRYMNQMREEYFIELAQNYFDVFVKLMIDSIKLSLIQSENKNIGDINKLIEVIKKIEKFDKNSLALIIEYFVGVSKEIFKQLESQKRVYLIEILSLDEKQFNFIYDLMQFDKENMSDYLKGLLSINVGSALTNFMKEYNENKIYKVFKKTFCKTSYFNRKKELYKNLMKSLSRYNNQIFDEIGTEYLKMILIDYYELFEEYEKLSNPINDINEIMSNIIDMLWTYLEITSKHIPLLETLSKSVNERLSIHSKYTLEKAYNQKLKDRNLPNSYYKEIFEEENMSQSVRTKLKNKWGELSMYEKIGAIGSVASIIGLLLYFIPSDSLSNNINMNNNNQSPIIQENHGNIIYNINNSKNETTNNNVQISNKIDNLINKTTVNIKGNSKDEQKEINSKIFILGEAKKINEKNIFVKDKNKECKNRANNAKNLLNYEVQSMYKVCDEIFKN